MIVNRPNNVDHLEQMYLAIKNSEDIYTKSFMQKNKFNLKYILSNMNEALFRINDIPNSFQLLDQKQMNYIYNFLKNIIKILESPDTITKRIFIEYININDAFFILSATEFYKQSNKDIVSALLNQQHIFSKAKNIFNRSKKIMCLHFILILFILSAIIIHLLLHKSLNWMLINILFFLLILIYFYKKYSINDILFVKQIKEYNNRTDELQTYIYMNISKDIIVFLLIYVILLILLWILFMYYHRTLDTTIKITISILFIFYLYQINQIYPCNN